MQPGDLPLGFLPIDLLDRFGLVVNLLPTFAKRLRAAADFGLGSLPIRDGCRPGVVGVGELDLQRDVALLVVPELSFECG